MTAFRFFTMVRTSDETLGSDLIKLSASFVVSVRDLLEAVQATGRVRRDLAEFDVALDGLRVTIRRVAEAARARRPDADDVPGLQVLGTLRGEILDRPIGASLSSPRLPPWPPP